MGRLRQSAVSPFAFAAAVLAWPAAVSAQASPGLPGPQQLNPAGQVSARPQQRHDLLEAPGPGACPLAASELTFRLASVELRGLKALTAAELAPAYAGDVGHDVRMASLCEIRDRVAALIFHKGILARVDIPPQHITDGRLVLQVTEARIASVRVVGDAG
ncbi:MAG TPA: POTRA domain-containing protein, partial [Caulobacteraceae bacterium]